MVSSPEDLSTTTFLYEW